MDGGRLAIQTQAESNRLNHNLSLDFKVREFLCFCCGKEGIKDDLVFHLQMVHDMLPVHRVMIITSGYRCPAHNKEVDGVEDSPHMKGLAADIKCEDSSHRFMLMKAFFKVGFTRIGVYHDFIHVDLDETKPQKVNW